VAPSQKKNSGCSNKVRKRAIEERDRRGPTGQGLRFAQSCRPRLDEVRLKMSGGGKNSFSRSKGNPGLLGDKKKDGKKVP